MRIEVPEYKQNVSTFNPALSHKEDFAIASGAAILASHCGGRSEVAGARSVFESPPNGATDGVGGAQPPRLRLLPLTESRTLAPVMYDER